MPGFAYLFDRFPSLLQTFCYREVLELRRQGVCPPVFSRRVPRDAPGNVTAVTYLPTPRQLTFRFWLGVPRDVMHFIREWGPRPGKMLLWEAAWLGRELRRRRIGHIHAHFAGSAARTAWWVKKFFGVTYSFTGHDSDLFCETPDTITLDDLLRDAEFIVTEADFGREWLRRRHTHCDGKVHRVYNGLDTAAFPCRTGETKLPRIVSVGRCVEKKGFHVLIAACALLRERMRPFECVLIGGGPLEKTLREQITERGLEKHVRLTGALPQHAVQAHLVTARLFVLPCVRPPDGGMDHLPTVIAEAMACGLPVVSTRIAGVPEMVEHGVTGLLTEEKNPEALADAMETILTQPTMAERLGQAGKAAADERFSSRKTAGQLWQLLKTVPGV